MGTKRRRIAHSCVDCRRRKVKCDRTMPVCVRCQKSGNSDNCKYIAYGGEENVLVTPLSNTPRSATSDGLVASDAAESFSLRPPKPFSGIMPGRPVQRMPQHALSAAETQGDRMNHDRISFGPHITRPLYHQTAIHSTSDPTNNNTDVKQVLLRGSSFKTIYHGPSSPASILLAFPELSGASCDMKKHFQGSAGNSKCFKHNLKASRQLAKQKIASFAYEHDDLVRLMPDRMTMDALVQRYIATCETTYHVQHIPTFWAQYGQYCLDPQSAPTAVVVLLLLILANVNCIKPPEHPSFIARSSAAHRLATEWITVSEKWLQSQSQKYTSVLTWQIRVLLLMAKRANYTKRKRLWTSAEELVRLATAAGMHREPTLVSEKITIFDAEMRRRIWAVIVELALAAATEAGLRPTVRAEDWDCQPPSNVHDDELNEDIQALPPSRPLHEFTNSSFLCVSLPSLPLRLEVLANVNHISRSLTSDVIARFDTELRQALADIPSWSDALGSATYTLPLASNLAKLQLLECLVLIHQPLATSKAAPGVNHTSQSAFRHAAASTLELYQKMPQTDAYTLAFPRNDIFRAGLCLAYELYYDTDPENTVTFNRDTAITLLQFAAQILEDRLMHLGELFQSFWHIVVALSLAYSKRGPPNMERQYTLEAVQCIHRVTERVLQLQSSRANVHISGETDASVGFSQPSLPGITGLPSPLDMSDVHFDIEGFGFPDFWGMGGLPDFD